MIYSFWVNSVNFKKVCPDLPSYEEIKLKGNISHIVGIGASAGGLEALEDFFREIPSNCSAAFIVIQHLSPDFKSFMPEILKRSNDMPIYTAEDGMDVVPNAIYVLPPKKNLVVRDRTIFLDAINRTNIPNRPIDLFFRSLAEDRSVKPIGIVLSGTGSDGSIGIKSIKDAGGIVLVQDPDSAKFDGMPRSAIATNDVDLTGTPVELAKNVCSHLLGNLRGEIKEIEDDRTDVYKLFKLIENKYDVDFSLYKTPTIKRRITKRLEIHRCKNIDAYLRYIDKNPGEVTALYYDMLIGVTQFFRDKEAFSILEKSVLPTLLKDKKDHDEVRVWTPGCASGEEPYSISLLLHEYARKTKKKLKIKIFATDIDENILSKATDGLYSEESVKQVDSSILKRYFSRRDSGEYQVNPKIRKSIVFARHNILKDPPFTKMDLVTCRNLLIYIGEEAQESILGYFYFSLRADGALFLGPSETLGKFQRAFKVIDRKWKLFQKLGTNEVHRIPNNSSSIGFPLLSRNNNKRRSNSIENFQTAELRSAFDNLLLSYIPSGLLVNEELKLFHVFGDAGKHLSNKAGPASNNLKSMLNEKVFLTLSVAIQRAKREKKSVRYVGVRNEGADSEISVFVNPIQLNGTVGSHYFVSLEPENVTKSKVDQTNAQVESITSTERFQILEDELQNTRENLQATIEELETTNEELQSTNEELLASNEELQSTNEELHSVNEELYTVNTEYQNKIDELTQLSNDEEHFLYATNVGAVFLTNNLHIRKFTPVAKSVFNILPQDLGRPIDHITHNMIDVDLYSVSRQVFQNNSEVVIEAETNLGRKIFCKVFPYKLSQGDPDGIVITFVDMTELREAERTAFKAKSSERSLLAIMDQITDGWWDKSLEDKSEKHFFSPKFKKVLGYEDHELLNSAKTWKDLVVTEDREKAEKAFIDHRDNNEKYDLTLRYKHKDGSVISMISKGHVVRDEKGKPIRMIGINTNITKEQGFVS